MYLLHNKKDGVYANISLSVYPRSTAVRQIQAISRSDAGSMPGYDDNAVLKCQPVPFLFTAVSSHSSYTVRSLARGELPFCHFFCVPW